MECVICCDGKTGNGVRGGPLNFWLCYWKICKFVNSAKILGSEVGIKTHINLITLPVSRSLLIYIEHCATKYHVIC